MATEDVKFQIVVRQFVDFEPELEFRGFVYEGKLTALTQYNEFVYFPRLAAHADLVSARIRDAFEGAILPALTAGHQTNYVVDFLLVGASVERPYDDLQVRVVELNPFAEFAGGGLFSWTADRAVLCGRAPFESRIVRAPKPACQQYVSADWAKFMFADQEDKGPSK